jgi:hypothetical protein
MQILNPIIIIIIITKARILYSIIMRNMYIFMQQTPLKYVVIYVD